MRNKKSIVILKGESAKAAAACMIDEKVISKIPLDSTMGVTLTPDGHVEVAKNYAELPGQSFGGGGDTVAYFERNEARSPGTTIVGPAAEELQQKASSCVVRTVGLTP